MAHVLFLQLQTFAFPGLYALCGALRAAGHTYRVEIPASPEDAPALVATHRPELVGFPTMTGIHREILAAAEGIKAHHPATPIILGGIHPTLEPEILAHPAVDFLCRGEGEAPLVELLDALQRKDKEITTPNISWKDGDGAPRHNPLRPLIQSLDALPFPDYGIYAHIPTIARDSYPALFMTRGCPYACSYCHNSNQRALFRGLGNYVRSLSVNRVLEEAEALLTHYPHARAVLLGSDTVGDDMPFLESLLGQFRQRFRIPYTCLVRPEFVSEELALLLARTGCHMVAFGVEAGSERVRRQLLRRMYRNRDILTAAERLRRHGVRFRTYNIVGFPSETPEEMLATLELNHAIRPDFPWCAIFTPYPGTRLAAFAQEQGYLPPDFSSADVPLSFFNDTVLIQAPRDFIRNLHAWFQLLVLLPWLTPLVRPLLHGPHRPIYRLIFKAVYAYVSLRSENRSLLSFLRLALANRRQFR